MADSLPFSIDPTLEDLNSGILGVSGLLRCTQRGVEIDYQTTNRTLETSEPTTITLTLDRLTAVDLRRRFLGRRLVLRASGLDALRGVPGAQQGTLTLKVARAHRAEAERIAWNLQSSLENRKLQA